MEEKKKSKTGLVFILILLALIVGLCGGYYITSNGYLDLNKKEEQSIPVKTETEELNLDSRLVKYLYNLVTEDTEESWLADWRLGGIKEEEVIQTYNYEKTDNIAMRIVGKNLKSEDIYEYYDDNGNSKGKVCDKEAVEKVYKEIFGKDAVLDTSVDIQMDWAGTLQYKFDSNLNKYVFTYIDGGGTGGPGGYTTKLTKAEKNGNTIKLYQNVKVTQEEDAGTGKYEELGTYTYTYELEDDGLYKFVSRKFESK